jgi:hypothetical protein
MTFTDCWIWTGAKLEEYAIVRRKEKAIRVHRLFWIALYGPIQEGKELDHLCRNKLCVNPRHLESVTHRVNVLRGNSPSAIHAGQTYASCGHPYDAKDSLRRYCKTCRTSWHRNYYRRNSHKILARQKVYRHAKRRDAWRKACGE